MSDESRYGPVYPEYPIVTISCTRCDKRCTTDKVFADRLTPWAYVCKDCVSFHVARGTINQLT